jgi:Ricin-type beta-trefoil lectin domain
MHVSSLVRRTVAAGCGEPGASHQELRSYTSPFSTRYLYSRCTGLGKCLDINGGGTSNGTTVDLYDCNGTGAQVWQPQSGGALYNPQSGKCLDDTGWSTTPGTQLQIWSCAGSANQNWAIP